MEEILNKNIFDDKELAKLAPNYSPSKVLLRMQMRSTMVKDTHSHDKKTEGWHRKTIKRTKDGNKIVKEIAKIRDGFQYVNLKNQIMLKNAVKYVDTYNSEHFRNGFYDELNALRHEEVTYLQNISDMDLSVQNDNLFKLNEKSVEKPNKVPKQNTNINNRKKYDHTNEKTKNDNGNRNNDFDFENILRIECTMVRPLSPSLDQVEENTITNEDCVASNKEESVIKLSVTSPQKEVDREVNYLQNLLTMLAISPQINIKRNEESNEHFKNVANKEKLNCIIQALDENDEVKSAEHDDKYDFLNVAPMRININERQKTLMKKYVQKWKTYLHKKKELLAQQREDKLNQFFDKLSKKKSSAVVDSPETPVNKAKLSSRDYNKYRHRYQMQKHIIALQKAKLEEQNRIIEELKYNRIVEASKMSVDAMREEVRRTYYEMDKQLKPKIKCLTSELKIEIEEPSLVLHCLKVPQFLQRMEKRAREREEKHAMIRERRIQMEEERMRLKQQEELAKAQMDKDEKIKRLNELKDKRKREKIENIRKKQHTERMRSLNVMAELHYEKTLKAKYGIRPFKILMELKRDNIEKSKAHYKFQLKKNIFLNWMWFTEDMLYERNFKAEDFHRKKVLRKIFDRYKQYHHTFELKKQVAVDYYDLYLSNLVFGKLREAIEVVKKENEMKFQIAARYHNSNLLFRAFCSWRTLPALNALKREQEVRKARWREKVLQVVPDYAPPDD